MILIYMTPEARQWRSERPCLETSDDNEWHGRGFCESVSNMSRGRNQKQASVTILNLFCYNDITINLDIFGS